METDLRPDPAIVFPGMGPSDFDGVARFLLINPVARRLLADADEVLGYSLFDRYREAKGDYTEHAQVAFLVVCLALAEWSADRFGVQPAVCAGTSFGGKVAAAYSGALTFEDAVSMTSLLARGLDEFAGRECRDLVTQSFARTPQDVLRRVLDELEEQGERYDISCRVDHDFSMVTLREDRLEWFKERLRAHGGLPLYPMRPPMHTRALAPLRDLMEKEVLAGLRFADPRIPVVADQDGAVLTTGDDVRTMLLDGFVRPVCWPDVLATFKRLNVGTLYISGPDRLFGRVECATRDFEIVPIDPRAALRPRRAVA